ncbi:hypothetical protein [Sporosarcina psychrophila]|uniref:hypothetical protein n=1 Tax=Sporosarcina psychrophila TaxID=1476 RepID=UPI00078BF1AF|nr:hypothetical protein [Sporosarcina psychrophila]AMQ05221.1 hypothetical protein AZE41_04305 [Sporosarcina psychrophila]
MWISKINFCKIYLYENEYEFFSNRRYERIDKSLIYFDKVNNNDIKSKEIITYNDNFQIVIIGKIAILFSDNFIKEYKEVDNINKSIDLMLKTINLTDKSIIKKYLNEVTGNITEIILSQENYFNYFDSPHLYGSKIQLSEEFETIMDNEDLLINKIKFQLLGNSTITIRDKNLLEFSENTSKQEKILFLNLLGQILNKE